MEFLDIFKKDKNEEVELKPGQEGYRGYSHGPASGSNKDVSGSGDGQEDSSSEETRLLPGLGDDKDKSNSNTNKRKSREFSSDKKALKRIESKLDKMLKQNKMIMEKLEGLDAKGSKSSDDKTVW